MSCLLRYKELCQPPARIFVLLSIRLQNQVSSVAGLDKAAGIHLSPSPRCPSANLRLCPCPGDYLLRRRLQVSLLTQPFTPEPLKARDFFVPKIIQPALVQTPFAIRRKSMNQRRSRKLKVKSIQADCWKHTSYGRHAAVMCGWPAAWLPACLPLFARRRYTSGMLPYQNRPQWHRLQEMCTNLLGLETFWICGYLGFYLWAFLCNKKVC